MAAPILNKCREISVRLYLTLAIIHVSVVGAKLLVPFPPYVVLPLGETLRLSFVTEPGNGPDVNRVHPNGTFVDSKYIINRGRTLDTQRTCPGDSKFSIISYNNGSYFLEAPGLCPGDVGRYMVNANNGNSNGSKSICEVIGHGNDIRRPGASILQFSCWGNAGVYMNCSGVVTSQQACDGQIEWSISASSQIAQCYATFVYNASTNIAILPMNITGDGVQDKSTTFHTSESTQTSVSADIDNVTTPGTAGSHLYWIIPVVAVLCICIAFGLYGFYKWRKSHRRQGQNEQSYQPPPGNRTAAHRAK